jgi:hypothetical protein
MIRAVGSVRRSVPREAESSGVHEQDRYTGVSDMLRLVRPLQERQATPRRGSLTDLEHLNLARTIRHLSRTTFGSVKQLAAEAGVPVATLQGAAKKRRGWGSAGLALRIAQAARISVEDVLSGKLVPIPRCPKCSAELEQAP